MRQFFDRIVSTEISIFFLMFTVVILLNIDFNLLRSARHTLSVVDLGGEATQIPLFELCGVLPSSVFMTWGLSKLMGRFSFSRVFVITLSMFLSFFLFFSWKLYPYLQDGVFGQVVTRGLVLLFYVMGALWLPALGLILFWGLVNQSIGFAQAKVLYAPLLLAGSLGGVISGPLTSFCTSERIWQCCPLATAHWHHTLLMITMLVICAGILCAWCYCRLSQKLSCVGSNAMTRENALQHGLRLCVKSPMLRLLAWTVIADYVAYTLGEVIFLDVLKQQYPKSCDYCNYMGHLGLWTGVLTVVSALGVTPWILRRYSWSIAALVAPVCLLLTEGAFFIFLRGKILSAGWLGWSEIRWISVIVFLGSLQFCLFRACKYTFLDASKELAFVLMPPLEKMQGKLIVDGLCTRIGRGGASALSLSLVQLCGGIVASAFLSGGIVLVILFSWLIATNKLGKLLQPTHLPAD